MNTSYADYTIDNVKNTITGACKITIKDVCKMCM